MMIRLAIMLTLAVTNASSIPAAASQCVSPTTIAAARTHGAAVRNQLRNAEDQQAACRAYAASFYESVTIRHAAADCVRVTGHNPVPEIVMLDSEIDAFNDLLATKCGS
jgi:hypothetical protein